MKPKEPKMGGGIPTQTAQTRNPPKGRGRRPEGDRSQVELRGNQDGKDRNKRRWNKKGREQKGSRRVEEEKRRRQKEEQEEGPTEINPNQQRRSEKHENGREGNTANRRKGEKSKGRKEHKEAEGGGKERGKERGRRGKWRRW